MAKIETAPGTEKKGEIIRINVYVNHMWKEEWKREKWGNTSKERYCRGKRLKGKIARDSSNWKKKSKKQFY